MTSGLRRRILVLQVGLIFVFGLVSGLAFWGSSFSHSQVSDQLAAQNITFPASDSKAITSLPPADADAMRQYGGQQLVNGDQAKVYADHFIQVHLNEIAGGQTYADLSAKAQANPTDTKLAGQVQTIFRGTTLRSMLLDAYGWWTVGTVAFYAAIAMLVATIGVVLALVFELWRWSVSRRSPEVVVSGASSKVKTAVAA
jgi:hypothetical protein